MTAAIDDTAVVFRRYALERVPELLARQDNRPHAATYGCCDPAYWQLRSSHLPNGDAQCDVWPLALACSLDLPGNPYFGQPALRERVEAGIRFAVRSGHADGACDEFFLHDRSPGATARSLLACVEACDSLSLEDPDLFDFLYRRADWLAARPDNESSSSVAAVTVLALLRCDQLTRSSRWLNTAEERLTRLLSRQNAEGWFPEDGGCDPGLHSYTSWCLALIQQAKPDPRLDTVLARAADLALKLQHPDGSCGGDYGSAGVTRFFAHGFELTGRRHTAALQINTRFVHALLSGAHADATLGHDSLQPAELASMLLTRRDWQTDRPPLESQPEHQRIWLPDAGLLIEIRGRRSLHAGMRRGGSFKLFEDGQLQRVDGQLYAQSHLGGRLRGALCSHNGRNRVRLEDDGVSVDGQLHWARSDALRPRKWLLLQTLLMTVARLLPGTARRLLDRLTNERRRAAPMRFQRRFRWLESGQLEVVDTLSAEDWSQLVRVGHVARARRPPGQDDDKVSGAAVMLDSGIDLTDRIVGLTPTQSLELVQTL